MSYQMTHGKNWRSAVAAAATAALMLTATPVAMADTDKVVSGVSVDASKLDVAAIDPAKTIDLTMVKKPDASAASVAGVTFRLQRLEGFDLLSNENWAAALKLKPALAANGPFVGDPIEITTDANGVARATGLQRGLYYVVELGNGNAELESSAPFVITLPSGNPQGTKWSYDLTVTAKNQPKEVPQPTPKPTPPAPQPTPPNKTVPVPIPIPVPIPKVSTATATPPAPTETVTPEAPAPAPAPAQKGVPRKVQQALASTGASVIGVVIAGALLVVAGIFLVGRRRKSEEA